MRNLSIWQQHWELRRKHMSSIKELETHYNEMERMWARMCRVLRRTNKLIQLRKKLKIP